MPESNKPFVVTDRRKFTKEGELRPQAAHTSDEPQTRDPRPEPISTPAPLAASQPPAPEPAPSPVAEAEPPSMAEEGSLPAPTPEQMDQVRFAYEQIADRIETAVRAANPGVDHPPPMNFEGLVQSVYLTAIMQLGGATPEGQRPRVEIMAARQSIDMLAVLAEKSRGNLTGEETKLLESALFELRMIFLEITEAALSRSAQPRTGAPTPPKPGIIL